ncbi:MAG: glycosyl hydrolase, partial [Luteolibacter sp.]
MNTLRFSTLFMALAAISSFAPATADPLESGFANPPAQAAPWCYYYWISDNISKEGITKDLEAMKRIGIGEALIGNIFLDNQPAGKIKVLSEKWWQLVEHAIREGGRLGVNIGMFNCPGWSQSGGPWVTAEQTMRYVISSDTRVTGPSKFSQKLPTPIEPFQDIAVLAFPAPQNDAQSLAALKPRISFTPAIEGAEKMADGDLNTIVRLPVKPGAARNPPIALDIQLDAPLTARSLRIHPTGDSFSADAELQFADSSGTFTTIRKFKCDRSNPAIGTGFMPRGPVTISFPATTGSQFRIIFTNPASRTANPGLAEIDLSGAARLESYIEKQLAKMHPTPLPLASTYQWPTQPEPDSPDLVVPASGI